jgi:hypothetical protein
MARMGMLVAAAWAVIVLIVQAPCGVGFGARGNLQATTPHGLQGFFWLDWSIGHERFLGLGARPQRRKVQFMAAPRLRRLSSKKDMESVIDDFVTQGYTIRNRGESSALLRKSSWGSGGGHLLWALLTDWFTLG